MTSVNTNAAAITALRTLQATNNQLDSTQARISTGLKIGEAKDNAAYWAISTSLKSDNKSLATVKDALGLGSATVDVAYQGLTKTKDVLDEIKAKLTAATQPGVDRDVIQAEIGELQKQLVSIAGSSVFSGENWLSVDSSQDSYTEKKAIVSSFSRDPAGSVTIGTIDVNTVNMALFDSNTTPGKDGILDSKSALTTASGRQLAFGGTISGTGNTSAAGLQDATDVGVSAARIQAFGVVPAMAEAAFTGNFTTLDLSGNTGADTINFVVSKDGTSRSITISGTDVATAAPGNQIIDNVGELVSAFNLNTVATANGIQAYSDGGVFKLRSTTAGSASSIALTTLGTTLSSTTTTAGAGGLTVTDTAVKRGAGEARIETGVLNLSGLTTNATPASADKIKVSLVVDGTTREFTTDVGTGMTTGANDLAARLNAASGFSTYAVASISSGKLVITGVSTGADKSLSLADVSYFATDGTTVKEPATVTGLPYSEKAIVKSSTFTGAITLDADDKLQFDMTVNGTSKLVTIDKAFIDTTLGGNSGMIGSVANYATVLTAAVASAGLTGVTITAGAVGSADAGKLVIATTLRGSAANVTLKDVSATKGANEMSVSTIDISNTKLEALGADNGDKIRQVIAAYTSLVNAAINKVTTAASNLGAVASRIDMQKSFVNTLMDTIDKGVGNLIDADMSEESTKLQALQVKQSLGVQALSIANQSAQSVLQLFR